MAVGPILILLRNKRFQSSFSFFKLNTKLTETRLNKFSFPLSNCVRLWSSPVKIGSIVDLSRAYYGFNSQTLPFAHTSFEIIYKTDSHLIAAHLFRKYVISKLMTRIHDLFVGHGGEHGQEMPVSNRSKFLWNISPGVEPRMLSWGGWKNARFRKG